MMKLLILSLLVSIVNGCIPDGFIGNGIYYVEDLKSCTEFNATVSCGNDRQTPIMPSELMKASNMNGKDVQEIYLSLFSVALDYACCNPQLDFSMALKPGYGVSYDVDGIEVYALSVNEPSDNVPYGPFDESYYKNASRFVREFLSNYSLQKPQTTALSLPLASSSQLINHAYIQSKSQNGPVEEVTVTNEVSDEFENDSIEWLDAEKEKKIVGRLLSVVAIGILGLESVVFLLALLIFLLPDDDDEEEDLLESLGHLLDSRAVETKDVGVQVGTTVSTQQKQQQPRPNAPAKNTSSSKSVPVLSKNKKIQKKNRAKSTIGQTNKKVNTMPMIQEHDEHDVCLDDVSTSNA